MSTTDYSESVKTLKTVLEILEIETPENIDSIYKLEDKAFWKFFLILSQQDLSGMGETNLDSKEAVLLSTLAGLARFFKQYGQNVYEHYIKTEELKSLVQNLEKVTIQKINEISEKHAPKTEAEKWNKDLVFQLFPLLSVPFRYLYDRFNASKETKRLPSEKMK